MDTLGTLSYSSGVRTNVSRLILGAGVFALLCLGMMMWLACKGLLVQFYNSRWHWILTTLPLLFLCVGLVVGTALLSGVLSRREGVRLGRGTLCLLVAILNGVHMLASNVYFGLGDRLPPFPSWFPKWVYLADWLAMFPQIFLMVAAMVFLHKVEARRDSPRIAFFATYVLTICMAMLVVGMVLRGVEELPDMTGHVPPFRFPYALYQAEVQLFYGLQFALWFVIAIWALRWRAAAQAA